jgi:hypothetical protein
MTTPLLPYTKLRQPRPDMMMAWLRTGERNAWYYLDRKQPPEQVWAEHREQVVAEHVKEHPGSRPVLWWQYTAPQARLRLGGVGQPDGPGPDQHGLIYGVPMYWGELSEADPPCFESEAAFLRRLGLFLPGEASRLGPEDFKPVFIRSRHEGRVGLYRT